MLFLKYLVKETMFPVFIPLLIASPFWLWYLIAWDLPYPWAAVSALFILGFGFAFLCEIALMAIGIHMYESTWEKGYLEWKSRQNLPPNREQLELEKIKLVLKRHITEYRIKRNNPAAQKMWEEYQCVLALSEGIETFEEIELNWFSGILKSNDDLK